MGAGGRREGGQVISIHIRARLTIGGRDGGLSYAFRERISKAFSDSGCSLAWENRMDAWLKYGSVYSINKKLEGGMYADDCD